MTDEARKDPAEKTDAGRRTLLKAAAVAGGATAAAALLPGSWKRPVATIGGLPAHAQVSNPITVTVPAAQDFPFPLRPRRVGGTSFADWVYTRSHYDDPLGDFDGSVELWTKVEPCGEVATRPLSSVSHTIDGTGFTGNVYFDFGTNCSPPSYIAWRFSKGGRTSNLVNSSILLAP